MQISVADEKHKKKSAYLCVFKVVICAKYLNLNKITKN